MAHQFKTTNIKGKAYVEVKERIKYFRTNPIYENWSLTTEIVQMTSEFCMMKATIANSEGKVLSTGFAHEVKEASYINKTSYIENCETSAWGRALANLGIGIDSSIASWEEVNVAITLQERGQSLKNRPVQKPVNGIQKSSKQKPWLNPNTDAYRLAVDHLAKTKKPIKATVEIKYQISKSTLAQLEKDVQAATFA